MVTLESWPPQLLCKYLLFEKGWFRLPFQNQRVSDVLKKKEKKKKSDILAAAGGLQAPLWDLSEEVI